MLMYGRNSRQATLNSLNEICRDLHCTSPSPSPSTSSSRSQPHQATKHIDPITMTSHPALEGTVCGLEMVTCRPKFSCQIIIDWNIVKYRWRIVLIITDSGVEEAAACPKCPTRSWPIWSPVHKSRTINGSPFRNAIRTACLAIIPSVAALEYRRTSGAVNQGISFF